MELDPSANALTKIFKAEYSNLVAVLCHYHGVDIQQSEDLVSDTFMQAMRVWSHKGVPDNPKAWLRKVATNKLRDLYRRKKIYDDKVRPRYLEDQESEEAPLLNEALIRDSQLRMIFAVCHTELKMESSICLALRLLCGFNVDEIAAALLATKASVNKKLHRAKQKLRPHKEDWDQLSEEDCRQRLDPVLRIIYLIFNEGYYSSSADVEVREEICWEALRLALLVARQDFLPQSRTHALIALMSFHASRLSSRTTVDGRLILYADQDRTQWDSTLITKGNQYLTAASTGDVISKYHLEAAIAYWHTTEASSKWAPILQLYNKLLMVEYNPIIALNRTYALAQVKGAEAALTEAFKLDQTHNHLYHSLIAELYIMVSKKEEALAHLKKAMTLTNREGEKNLITSKMEKLNEEA